MILNGDEVFDVLEEKLVEVYVKTRARCSSLFFSNLYRS